uniref:NADH dehydrogenase subunit 6 n=1 Tax=Colpocephalum eucarenum TaxID=2965266 RepID=UPI0026E11D24|nr:NADH dehydrogenase subunit 6 [Colpocephalum eucarenum]WIM51522.1 NADH dehydrogenase subunit 6 [Colpocephalum eucarenum]
MKELSWLIIFFCFLMIFLFFFSSDLIICLMCLFFFTFLSCLICFLQTKMFWGLGLMIIVMATGLFLVFAYIVSLNPQIPSSSFSWKKKFFVLTSLMTVFILTYSSKIFSRANFFFWSFHLENLKLFYKSDFLVSLFLICLLLMLVIFFIRFTYNKGGSLRKKY